MEPRKKLELTPEEQEAERRDAALMAMARAMSSPPPKPLHELIPGSVPVPDLIYWAGLGRLFKVKIALNNGAELDQFGPFGTSALHDAAANGHLEVVRLLVEQGADVGLQSQGGQTALELARQAGHTEVAAYLQGASG
jgi:ankyrin repeat protein